MDQECRFEVRLSSPLAMCWSSFIEIFLRWVLVCSAGLYTLCDMSMLTGRRQQLTLKSEICCYCTPFTNGIGKVKLSLHPVFWQNETFAQMIYQINMRVAPFLINFEKNDQIVFQNFTSLPFLFPFFFHLSLNCVFCATNTEMFLTNLFNLFTCLNCYFLPLPLLPLSFMFLPIHSFFTFFFFCKRNYNQLSHHLRKINKKV